MKRSSVICLKRIFGGVDVDCVNVEGRCGGRINIPARVGITKSSQSGMVARSRLLTLPATLWCYLVWCYFSGYGIGDRTMTIFRRRTWTIASEQSAIAPEYRPTITFYRIAGRNPSSVSLYKKGMFLYLAEPVCHVSYPVWLIIGSHDADGDG